VRSDDENNILNSDIEDEEEEMNDYEILDEEVINVLLALT
jgi:hypothetical protein